MKQEEFSKFIERIIEYGHLSMFYVAGKMNQEFVDFIQTVPISHKRETSRWDVADDKIIDKQLNRAFDHNIWKSVLNPILTYFKEWNVFGTMEAQVLVVTSGDYEKYYAKKCLPVIPTSSNYKLVVLPQVNTPTNTIVDEAYWHKTVQGEPVMRVHSHHVLNAYQSDTDYNSLNSGTLEVVLGKVNTNEPEIAYWLTRHSDVGTKDYVVKTKY